MLHIYVFVEESPEICLQFKNTKFKRLQSFFSPCGFSTFLLSIIFVILYPIS